MQALRIQTIRPPKSPKPDVVALASRFVEPLARENRPAPAQPASSRPRAVASFTGQPMGTGTQPNQKMAPAKPMARGKPGLPINVLISALVVIALVPSAILFVQLWRDMMRPHSVTLPVTAPRTAERARPAGLDYPKKDSSRFEVKDNDGDAGDGAPGSAGGWSFASEETGALPLSVPGQSSKANMTLEPDAGDGTILAQPETQVSIAPAPAEVATVASLESNPFEQVAPAEQPTSEAPQSAADTPPPPERKPSSAVAEAPAVKVTKVKVVTIEPPQPTRPHDGAYALGSPADEAQAPAEWMETKTAVDMHAKAEQSSETVKVADKGLKLRVTARDKNWVQVNDSKSATTGWIYNRFLQPTEPPAQ